MIAGMMVAVVETDFVAVFETDFVAVVETDLVAVEIVLVEKCQWVLSDLPVVEIVQLMVF